MEHNSATSHHTALAAGSARQPGVEGATATLARPASVLPNEALFWTPRHKVSDRVSGHAPFLFWLTEAVGPRVVLQLGLDDISGYLAICQAAERLAAGTLCFGVAGNRRPQPTEADYEPFSRICTGGLAALDMPADSEIDLLVIHDTLDAALAEQLARLVVPRLSDRAVIVICDPQRAEAGAIDGLHKKSFI